jgi:hypothetical protein
VAGRQRPSFLKRQKEEARRARANRKREERQARRHVQDLPPADPETAAVAEEPAGREPEGGPVTT